MQISSRVTISDDEIELSAIRSQGAGGQNVNKVSTAIHLRFDILASSLPDVYKENLLKTRDQRISKDGVIVIKAQQFRTLEKNKADALQRLQSLIRMAGISKKVRKATKPSKAAKLRRLESKSRQSLKKSTRGKPKY